MASLVVILLGIQIPTVHPGTLEPVSERPGAYPFWAPDGRRLVYQRPIADGRIDLVITDLPTGAERTVVGDAGRNVQPAWSPDGAAIAFVSDRSGNQDVYRYDLATGRTTNLTNHRAIDIHPYWHPDGSRLVFNSGRADTTGNDRFGEIYTMTPTGQDVRRVTHSGVISSYASWSPRGTAMAHRAMTDLDLDTRRGNAEIFLLPTLDAPRRRLTTNPAVEGYPSWAPDGRHIVYASNRDGRFQIFTLDPVSDRETRLFAGDADFITPVWSPEGVRLAVTAEVGGIRRVFVWHPPRSPR